MFVVYLATIGSIVSGVDFILNFFSLVKKIDGYEIFGGLIFACLLYGGKYKKAKFMIPFLVSLLILILTFYYKTFQMMYKKTGFDTTLFLCDILLTLVWIVTYEAYIDILPKEQEIIEMERTFKSDIQIPIHGNQLDSNGITI